MSVQIDVVDAGGAVTGSVSIAAGSQLKVKAPSVAKLGHLASGVNALAGALSCSFTLEVSQDLDRKAQAPSGQVKPQPSQNSKPQPATVEPPQAPEAKSKK